MKRAKLPEWFDDRAITLRVLDGDAVLYVNASRERTRWVVISVSTSNLAASIGDAFSEGTPALLVAECRTMESARKAGEKYARKWLRERAKARAQNVTPPTSDRLVSGPTEIFN